MLSDPVGVTFLGLAAGLLAAAGLALAGCRRERRRACAAAALAGESRRACELAEAAVTGTWVMLELAPREE